MYTRLSSEQLQVGAIFELASTMEKMGIKVVLAYIKAHGEGIGHVRNNKVDAAYTALPRKVFDKVLTPCLESESSAKVLPECIQHLDGDVKEQALWRLSGRFSTWGKIICRTCSSLHDFCIADEGMEEHDPTVVKEDWHMSLEEAQEVDRMALGQQMSAEKAQELSAQVEDTRRTIKKAKPLMHL